MKQIKKYFPHPYLSLALLISWLLLNNTIEAGHILLGAILGLLIPWFSASFWPERVCLKSPFTLIKFLLVVLYDIVVANIIVAKQVLGENSKLNPTFFELPLDIDHPLGISILASTISLTPGTVSCDLSEDSSYLTIHGLSVEDVASEIASIKERYEKPLLEVFTKC